ncbi:hypothetical protein [Cryptosporangium japonicum]|uniref:Uncharacterized protein n=1 Tax=Cryptosporangium japonicum TaxID=80872 RepID=A0ABP3ESL2_9ACTN
MDRTTLVAAVALGLGLLLACGGSVILAHARAAVRADSPRHGSITQFPAALSALLGFLLTSVSGAVLCWRLVPERGATALLAAIVAGVILFALVGAGFARVADRVEERRLLKVPDEVHRPISPPPRRAALTAASSTREQRAPDQRALEQRPLEQRTPEQRTPTQPTPEQPRPVRALPRPRPTAESAPHGYATPLVPVPPRPTAPAFPDAPPPADAAPEPAAPDRPAPDRPAPDPSSPDQEKPVHATPALDPATSDRRPPDQPAPEEPATDLEAPDTAGEPAPTVEAAGTASGDPRWGDLDAGWMYHDEADGWFLAVGTADGSCTLLGLPSFALITPDGPEAPRGTLTRAGAAELTVLPDDEDVPDTPLTEENSVNEPSSDPACNPPQT